MTECFQQVQSAECSLHFSDGRVFPACSDCRVVTVQIIRTVQLLMFRWLTVEKCSVSVEGYFDFSFFSDGLECSDCSESSNCSLIRNVRIVQKGKTMPEPSGLE